MTENCFDGHKVYGTERKINIWMIEWVLRNIFESLFNINRKLNNISDKISLCPIDVVQNFICHFKVP